MFKMVQCNSFRKQKFSLHDDDDDDDGLLKTVETVKCYRLDLKEVQFVKYFRIGHI